MAIQTTKLEDNDILDIVNQLVTVLVSASLYLKREREKIFIFWTIISINHPKNTFQVNIVLIKTINLSK